MPTTITLCENIISPALSTAISSATSNASEEMTESHPDVLTCKHCSNILEESDAIYHDGEHYCQVCADELTFVCYDCGTRHWNDVVYTYNGRDICECCYDYDYDICEGCGQVVRQDDLYSMDDDEDYRYCYSCYDKRRGVIRSYDYKPEPLFYDGKSNYPISHLGSRTGLFYGIELEIDKGGEDAGNAKELLLIGNNSNEHIYIKHDGSLNDGFEIVSHPMSMDYHMNKMPWEKMFKSALRLDYFSHDTSTCGLHIHVDREALGSDVMEQENTVARILYFIEKHWDKLLIFSRRNETQIARWANRYGLLGNPKETLEGAKKSNSGRYVCLNLQNDSTIEFRIFRGTLKYSTFIATLQLVDEICNKAISMSDADFQAMTWNSFVLEINQGSKQELKSYLVNRHINECLVA